MYTNWPMLSEEHISVAQMCKEFSDSEVAICDSYRDRDHTYTKELVTSMAELGLMGVSISSDYGGSDMDYVSYAIAVEGIYKIIIHIYNY